jgi:ubiquinone/menaquinone biosynthesis C-methylase UbiE
MRNILRKFWHKIRFEQKKEWDRIAYNFLNNCEQIIDVGCGVGRFISQNPTKIIGLDLNDNSVEAGKKLGYNIINGDIRNLPFKNETISGIHCSHVIEHFLPIDVHKILSEFNRILVHKGIIVIRTPLLYNGFYSDLTHIRPYNSEAIIHYLKPSSQRTLSQISEEFEVIYLKYRYVPLKIKIKYLNMIFNVLNRWGFPWIKKSGYMLVLQKK